MVHGRDHDERSQKYPQSRANNTPPDDEVDEAVTATTRAPAIGGSDPAPTRKAMERERERHLEEERIGRVAAGRAAGNQRDERMPGVTREELDEAARTADRRVAGHEIDDATRRE